MLVVRVRAARAWRVAEQLDYGMVGINEVLNGHGLCTLLYCSLLSLIVCNCLQACPCLSAAS